MTYACGDIRRAPVAFAMHLLPKRTIVTASCRATSGGLAIDELAAEAVAKLLCVPTLREAEDEDVGVAAAE